MATIDSRGFASAPGTTTAGIQEAIDAIPLQGAQVLLPSGLLTTTTTIYTPCDRPCNLIGEGAGINDTHGTVIVNAAGTDIIRLRGDHSSIRGIRISGAGSSAASTQETGRGIVVGRRNVTDPHPNLLSAGTEITHGGASAGIIRNTVIEDVRIYATSGWGLFVSGFGNLSDGATPEANALANATLSIFNTINRVWVQRPSKYGCVFIGGGCTTQHFIDSVITDANNSGGKAGADAYYAYLSNAEKVVFDHCTFEGYCPGTKPWVQCGASFGVDLDHCWFEEDAGDIAGTPTWFIQTADGLRGLSIINPHFSRDGSSNQGKPRLIQLVGASRSVLIANPFCQMGTHPYVSPTWVEQNHIDLASNNNQGSVTVVGPGTLWDVDTSGGGAQSLDIQYAGVPRFSVFAGAQVLKIPSLTIAERDATTRQPWYVGSIINVTDGTSPGLQVYKAGAWYHFPAAAQVVNAAGD